MHYIFGSDDVMHYIFYIIFIDLFRLRDLLEIYDFSIIFIDLFRFRDLIEIYDFEELIYRVCCVFFNHFK